MTRLLSPSSRVGQWIVHAVYGIEVWLVVCAVLAAFGFWFAPGDYRDRATAREVQRAGVIVIASDVDVHVDHEYAKGGGWYEVDQVRVRLPGVAGRVTLDAVANEDTLDEGVDWQEGWQPATPATGYQAPLRVKVESKGDGTPQRAVAERDLEYWTVDNSDPEIGLSIGGGFLLLGLISMIVKSMLSGANRRQPALDSYPGKTRAARRAARRRGTQGPWSAGKASRTRTRHRR